MKGERILSLNFFGYEVVDGDEVARVDDYESGFCLVEKNVRVVTA